ncbi:inorganic phosphate transporter [Nonomuraea sp. NPDC049646]|uniref:inorganic phosphate transporter n=1 Tax=unclassified Nonomuraea TaxID=2593643 RepID=UPI0037B6C6E0
MDVHTVLLAVVVATALTFAFTNGFHDMANAMATSIAAGALRPRTALALSAMLSLAGAFLLLKVAATIARTSWTPAPSRLPWSSPGSSADSPGIW